MKAGTRKSDSSICRAWGFPTVGNGYSAALLAQQMLAVP